MQPETSEHPKASLKGILLLFAALVPAGIVIGALASLIGRFVYLIVFFPLAMGAAAGVVIKAIAMREKIRSAVVLIAAGVFSAVLIFGSMHYFDYVIAQEGQAAPSEKVQAFIDYALIEETGSSGFVGYVLLEAREGVSISRVGTGSSDSGINLGRLTWLYWLVELVLIGWMSVASSYKLTKDLFCEHCGTWVPEGEHIGGVNPEFFNQALELIKSKDFAELARMLQNDTRLPSVEFYTRTCKTCTTFPFYLTAYVLSSGRQAQTQSKLIMAQALTASERYAFTSALEERKLEVRGALPA
jgi:hypothetical protein